MNEPNGLKYNDPSPLVSPANDSSSKNGASSSLVDDECAEFQARMPSRIGAGEDLQAQPHMLTCERCRSLVRDLEYIAEAARQLMPVEAEPRDELWTNIRLAIERGDA
jgi:hypothetical protein